MGLVVLEGLIILVLVLTGFRKAVFHAVPAQLKIAISVGIGLFIALIGLVDAGFVHRIADAPTTTVPVAARLGRSAPGLAGRWSSCSACCCVVALYVRKVRGRDPDLDRRHHACSRSSSRDRRRRRPGRSRPGDNGQVDGSLDVPTLEAERPGAGPTTSSPSPDFVAARRVQPARRLARTPASSTAAAVRLHAAARRLLRHHGHDDRDRRRGRPARRGRHPAEHPADPVVDSLAAAAGGAAGVSSNTSYIESRLGCRRGRAHRPGLAWSPACCSCWPCSSRRWSRSSRPRRPYRRWSWSAS